jgi:hypothetical protein
VGIRGLDITNNRFGKLVAVKRVGLSARGAAMWLMKCDCGGERVAILSHLKRPRRPTAACGLCCKKQHEKNLKHGGVVGGTEERLYRIWRAMRQRCEKPYSHAYKTYGAAGISVCNEWKDYSTFRSWAMANGYDESLTIDRVDPSWNYDPSNCEWVTRSVNSWRRNHPGHYWRSMTLNG